MVDEQLAAPVCTDIKTVPNAALAQYRKFVGPDKSLRPPFYNHNNDLHNHFK
jgi:hypothetical protein